MAAMPAAMLYDSASSKKPGVRAAMTNRKPDPLCTLWAVALVGGFIAVDIHARVDVAARELYAHELTLSDRLAVAAMAGRAVAGQI